MKTALVVSVLLLSLAVNGLLVQWHRARETRASAAGAVALPVAPEPSTSSIGRSGTHQTAFEADLAREIAAARAAGLPAGMLRAWAQAEVNEHFLDREQALHPPRREHYWQATPRRLMADRIALAELHVEKNLLLDRLLGYDPARPENEPYRFLPREKQEQVKAIAERYATRLDLLRTATSRMATASEEAEIARLENESRQELGEFLNAAEQTQLNLRLTALRWTPPPPDALGKVVVATLDQPLVDKVRHNLRHFDATEQEFIAIHAVEQVFDPHRRHGGMDSSKIAQSVEDGVRAALGEARFSDYQLKATYDYARIGDVVARLGQPASVAAEVGAIRDRVASAAKHIHFDKSLDGAGKKEALKTLAATERARVLELMGADGAAALSGTLDRWLRPLDQGRIPVVEPGGHVTSTPVWISSSAHPAPPPAIR